MKPVPALARPEPSDTREAILDAAERVFARDGLRAARTETIAAEVGITKAMIHYYFRTKEALYVAVLERIRAQRETAIDYNALQRLPPREALQQYVERLLAEMNARPHTVPLFALENIQNGGRYYGGPAASMDALARIIARGVRAGAFRRVDPRHTALNITGACLHYFNVAENVRLLWPRATQRELLDGHRKAVLDFVLAALSV